MHNKNACLKAFQTGIPNPAHLLICTSTTTASKIAKPTICTIPIGFLFAPNKPDWSISKLSGSKPNNEVTQDTAQPLPPRFRPSENRLQIRQLPIVFLAH
ncbi:hypothetical protein [Neisseria weixii]|uniref:hypothetical protein n=1 Tax=Neisseria weixii TaxID=1853276 RepID=UPI00403A201E